MPISRKTFTPHVYKKKLQVRLIDVMSNRINVRNEVRQGGVMSPLLFRVYMDGLLNGLKQLGIGCYIGQHFCGLQNMQMTLYYHVLLFMDCEKLLKCVKIYHYVLFNEIKSKLLVYNKKDADPHCEINGSDISTFEKTIHLEMYLPQPISIRWCLTVLSNVIIV